MIKKLRTKFIIVTMCVIFVVIGGIIGIINAVNFSRINSDSNIVISVLADNNGTMPLPNIEDKENPMPSLPPETPFQTRYFTVTVKGGEVVSVNNSKIFKLTEEQAITQTKEVISQGQTDGYFGDYKLTKISVDDGDMYIFLDCSKDLYFARNFLKISIMIGAIAIILIFGLVWIFSSIVVKPIAESYSKQKRFITDANHEIKTPLAIIGATNEVMELKFGENEWSDTINNQVKKLTALTERLVFLSRMDEENAEIPMVEFNLSETVNEVSEPFKNLAKISNKTFNLTVEQNLKGVGDVSLIGQLVSILLENAFKYSNDNGNIDLYLSSNGKNNKIIVANTTDGVDKKNLDKLFDRFYRSDDSRNSETGGNGIGLSIAKSIVNIHKGKIFAKSDDGKYIVFTVII